MVVPDLLCYGESEHFSDKTKVVCFWSEGCLKLKFSDFLLKNLRGCIFGFV
jgi:hypothetical protein